MSDPIRWRGGEAPPGVDDLLRSARRPRAMSPAERSRSAIRIDRLAALPVAAGALLWLKGVAFAATVGVATIAVVQLAPSLLREETPVVTQPIAPPPTVARPAAVVATASATVSATPEVSAAVSSARPAPSAPRAAVRDVDRVEAPREEPPPTSPPTASVQPPELPVPTASAAAPPPIASAPSPADSLSQETAMLEEARALLGKNPAAALAKLDAHAAAFPRGKMGLERELMAVDALRRMGRTDAARSRAEALAARTKGSIYEDRVKRLLEQIR